MRKRKLLGGRFIVNISFKNDTSKNSKYLVEHQLMNLERRFKRELSLKIEYKKFFQNI